MNLYSVSVSDSPGGDFDAQESVDGDGQQGQYGALGDEDEKARNEEASVKLCGETQADDHRQRNDKSADRNIGQRQRDNKAEGRVSKTLVHPHHQDHQHVPKH